MYYLNEYWINSAEVCLSLIFVSKCQTDYLSNLVQWMAWLRLDDQAVSPITVVIVSNCKATLTGQWLMP